MVNRANFIVLTAKRPMIENEYVDFENSTKAISETSCERKF